MYSLDSHLLNINTLMVPKAGVHRRDGAQPHLRGSPSDIRGRDVYLLLSHSCSHNAEGLQIQNKESSQGAQVRPTVWHLSKRYSSNIFSTLPRGAAKYKKSEEKEGAPSHPV